jgi:hypothetical protein
VSFFDTLAAIACQFPTWYASDASFAWWPPVDTDTIALNPLIGAALPLTTGAGATTGAASGGQTGPLWLLGGTNVYSNSANYANIVDTAKSAIFIVAVDTNSQSAGGVITSIGSGSAYFTFGKGVATPTTRFALAFTSVGGVSQSPLFITAASFPAGGTQAVHWMIYDAVAQTVSVGFNLTTVSTTPLTAFTPGASIKTNNIYIGATPTTPTTPADSMKHSAVEWIQRTGSIAIGDAHTPGSALFEVNKVMRACNISGFV